MIKPKIQAQIVSAKKLPKKPLKTDCSGGAVYLDKLAQLGTPTESKAPEVSENQKYWQKKAKKKAVSYAISSKLLQVENSPLHKAYLSTLYCNKTILQDGQKATTEYCKQRWCPICSGNRTADLINGYLPTLIQLGNLWFVTLTASAVKGNELKQQFKTLVKAFRHIQHNTLRKKHNIRLQGIRKLETNYNAKEGTFNAHIHCVLSAENMNDMYVLVQEWLYYFPDTTDRDAQKIQKVDYTKKEDKDFLLELFKYTTKTVTKDGFCPEAQDIIYTALKRSRAIQPIGSIKKIPKDKIKRQAVGIDFQPTKEGVEIWEYVFRYFDWKAADSTDLTGYKPDEKTKRILKKIDNHRTDFKRL